MLEEDLPDEIADGELEVQKRHGIVSFFSKESQQIEIVKKLLNGDVEKVY